MQKGGAGEHLDAPFDGELLANADAAILDVEAITLTSAEFAKELVSPKEEETVVTQAAVKELAAPKPDLMPEVSLDVPVAPSETLAELSCDITASARSVAAAMVNLTLSAPCLPNERLTVHHSGLLFNETTDAEGALDISVPAMVQDATFIFAFTNGEGAVSQSHVEELADFDRVVLQWKGDTGFELHAREFGAEYGSQGHVWSGAARDMSFAVTGQGGFIYRLGDPSVPDGLMAEVYTFPTNAAQHEGNIDLSVETEVASNNCGLEIEAQTLQTHSGNDITSRDLTLSVPDCEAVGNFLVLNNLLEDLKVASN
ncbi:MAG: hypothetical protein ABJJ03_13955 [Sulfitobacter sp.]